MTDCPLCRPAIRALLLVTLCLTASKVKAESATQPAEPATLAGHSTHGDTFDEGPRRGAYLMAGTGNVHLPVTCKTVEAQRFFDQGIGQLHGFWYLESERSFRQVAALDPDCAMAYWGMAMANTNNRKRARDFIAEAVKRKAHANLMPVEIAWIDALAAFHKQDSRDDATRDKAFTNDLKAMHKRFPDNLEIRAFLALYIWEFGQRDDFKLARTLQDEIFAIAPMHPANHYRIHLLDGPEAKDALTSAANNGPAAPGIAHMWHMPGHIYSDLHRYIDAAWQQEASARVDHAYMIRDRVMPYEIHNYAHNNEWLIRDLINVGRVHDGLDLARNMIELPRHPRYNETSNRGSGAAYGRARLIDVLALHQMWGEYLQMCDSVYLSEEGEIDHQVRKLRYQGVAYAALNRSAEADGIIGKLQELRKLQQPTTRPSETNVPATQPTNNKIPTTGPSENKTGKAPATVSISVVMQIDKSLLCNWMDKPLANLARGRETVFEGWASSLTSLLWHGRLARLFQSEDMGGPPMPRIQSSSNSTILATFVARSRSSAHSSPTTQRANKQLPTTRPATPAVKKPEDRAAAERLAAIDRAIHHINAQKAMASGDFAKAATLLTSAQARKEHVSLAYLAAKDFPKAEEQAKQAVAEAPDQTYPLANQVLVLHRIGKKAEAANAFDKLREISEAIDLTVEPYKTLCTFAAEYGFKEDWRQPRKKPADLGQRPPLDQLGPFRWHPADAPDWIAISATGAPVSLSQYHGKPVLVLFYLGHGCSHCVRQIHAFADAAKDYSAAGISIVAIGTDPEDTLGKTWSVAGIADKAIPFPLASDSNLGIFKSYHCFDDFENVPLHGTFLIDPAGKIRWQDISYEPFMDTAYLLKESKRLLAEKP